MRRSFKNGQSRKKKVTWWFDLSVPANIAVSVANHDSVEYVNIDQLRQLADRNLISEGRKFQLPKPL